MDIDKAKPFVRLDVGQGHVIWICLKDWELKGSQDEYYFLLTTYGARMAGMDKARLLASNTLSAILRLNFTTTKFRKVRRYMKIRCSKISLISIFPSILLWLAFWILNDPLVTWWPCFAPKIWHHRPGREISTTSCDGDLGVGQAKNCRFFPSWGKVKEERFG